MAQSIEDLLRIIAADGLQVNNLFQRGDGSWQANVRKMPVFHEIGVGTTAFAALSNAIAAYQKSHKVPKINPVRRLVIVKRPAK